MFTYDFIRYLCKKLDTPRNLEMHRFKTTGVDYITNITYGEQLKSALTALFTCTSIKFKDDAVVISLSTRGYRLSFFKQFVNMLNRELQYEEKVVKGQGQKMIFPIDVFAHLFYYTGINDLKTRGFLYKHYNVINFIEKANEFGQFSKCVRAKMGAILVKDGEIKYSARNGHPVKTRLDHVCDRKGVVSGTEFQRGICMHAEWNLICKASKKDLEGGTVYINAPPCTVCTRMLIQTGVNLVIFREEGYSLDGVKLAYRLNGKTKFFGVKYGKVI